MRLTLGHFPGINERLSSKVVEGADLTGVCESELVSAWRKDEVKTLKDFKSMVSEIVIAEFHMRLHYFAQRMIFRGM